VLTRNTYAAWVSPAFTRLTLSTSPAASISGWTTGLTVTVTESVSQSAVGSQTSSWNVSGVETATSGAVNYGVAVFALLSVTDGPDVCASR
jgi:hypothetical protein